VILPEVLGQVVAETSNKIELQSLVGLHLPGCHFRLDGAGKPEALIAPTSYGPHARRPHHYERLDEFSEREYGRFGGNRAPKNIMLHHNLYANLGSRTTFMQHADVFDFRNNVIYNWSGNNASVFGQFALNSSAFGNVVNNLWLAGPESGYPYLNVGNGGPTRIDGKPAEAGGTKLYLAGNCGPRAPAGSTNDWIGIGVNTWDHYEFKHDGSPHLVEQKQYDAGKPFAAPPVGLDAISSPNDARDGAAFATNGYTNVENYLNELAGDPIP